VEQERLAAPLYRPYSKLVEITILGRKFQVPENNLLLRAFQFLCPEDIPYGRYCWNEECQYCRVTATRSQGAQGAKVQQALSCKLMVEEGMEISELSTELRWNMRELFGGDPEEPMPPEQPPGL
jgi:hypothetical protein